MKLQLLACKFQPDQLATVNFFDLTVVFKELKLVVLVSGTADRLEETTLGGDFKRP